MKQIILLALLLVIAVKSHAEIYKWTDENGRTHFSDRPTSKNAEKVNIRGTGILFEKSDEQIQAEEARRSEDIREQALKNAEDDKQDDTDGKAISAADYRITSSVGKLGSDAISISGRISSGPPCKDMVVTATARNDNGLSGSITQHVTKSNSFGSTIFQGTAQVYGSAEDRSFWKVDSVTVTCND